MERVWKMWNDWKRKSEACFREVKLSVGYDVPRGNDRCSEEEEYLSSSIQIVVDVYKKGALFLLKTVLVFLCSTKQ